MRAGEQLLAAMVRVQDVDEERWYPATVMRVTPKAGGEEKAFTLSVWAPDVAMIAFDGRAFVADVLHVVNRAARDVHSRARLDQSEGDATAYAATRAGHERHFAI